MKFSLGVHVTYLLSSIIGKVSFFMEMYMQAKIGNKNFEDSLQALRGSDVDVSLEEIEIKVFFYTKCAHSVVYTFPSVCMVSQSLIHFSSIIHFPFHFHFQNSVCFSFFFQFFGL